MSEHGGILPQEVIRKKRDGQELDAGEIDFLVSGLARGALSEGQAAAFAMAVFFRGMTIAECVSLTRALRGSRQNAALARKNSSLAPSSKKTSTGGVREKCILL